MIRWPSRAARSFRREQIFQRLRELGLGERLVHPARHSQLREGFGFVVFHATAGHHDGDARQQQADFANEGESIHVRHVQVGDDGANLGAVLGRIGELGLHRG